SPNAFDWTLQPIPLPANYLDGPHGLVTASKNSLYALYQYKVYFSTGNGTWTDLMLAENNYEAGFAFSADDVVIAGSIKNGSKGLIVRKKGSGSFVAETIPADARPLKGVFGDGGNLWAAGDSGELLFSTGNGSWTRVPSGTIDGLVGVYAAGG